MDLEAFRQQLVVWGITPNVLMFIGIASIITLFFSVRVVIKWYFGIHALQNDLQSMKKQLNDIQLLLTASGMSQTILTEEIEPPADFTISEPKNENFRLTNH